MSEREHAASAGGGGGGGGYEIEREDRGEKKRKREEEEEEEEPEEEEAEEVEEVEEYNNQYFCGRSRQYNGVLKRYRYESEGEEERDPNTGYEIETGSSNDVASNVSSIPLSYYGAHRSAIQLSPGLELFHPFNAAVELSEGANAEHLLHILKLAGDKKRQLWFKFVCFRLPNGEHKMYIIPGNPNYNKHSLCVLQGYYDYMMTQPDRYRSLIDKYDEIIAAQRMSRMEILTEKNPLIVSFNKELFNEFGCMPVLLSGSGTYMGKNAADENIVGLNAKSGHYRIPTDVFKKRLEEGLLSRFLPGYILELHKVPTEAQLTKNNLIDNAFFGYTGICLTEEELSIASVRKKSKKSKKKGGTRRKHKRTIRKRRHRRTYRR